MKNKIKLPKGWELKKLESGIYEVVKKPFKLEVGKDYVSEDGKTIVIDRNGDRWNNGFHTKRSIESRRCFSTSIICSKPSYWKEATEEQVREAFEKELLARYGEDWKNVKIKECMYFGERDNINISAYNCYIKKDIDFKDGWSVWNKNGCLYSNGKWAEVLEEKKVATNLSEIDRPYYISVNGYIAEYAFHQTKNHMTSIELCEGILALQQLISFRDSFYEVHGRGEDNCGGAIYLTNTYKDCFKFEAIDTARGEIPVHIFEFDTYEQAKEFLSTHKDLFEELKKLY